ncbi:MAG: c-type cytochrome biogenesis protein CcmI [Rhodospirillaceae bacterium]|jgi:cytochrome c-type biogenesis protein CcmH|nr:c-type cytochrome biogenesis protein CcmI [Rhodospirillaceae bacterium]MBT4773063.1 c-type cytochrome biogenesis protein CcmI [Rhodospirillaceae bacterium]MBT5358788.1 c-type cytochrome biogenesis protein CcmI [Rhodospirillaceae bacterium]MBT5768513.1 c-type cytochrome biogenesis protein CcmI [Rhodospirillaceae bacterium]MBT6308342.1 c-type cytochrome biogenesis protein CcmI [Rhodospirillaceae bacterium]
MIFWIILAALTVSLIAWITWPLLRPGTGDLARAEYDAAVYYDQLQELERDHKRGLIDDTQADAARGEIERRLLAAGRAAGMSGKPLIQRHPILAAALVILVPLASVPIYLDLGTPGLPNLPFATRDAPPEATGGVVAAARSRLQEAEARTATAPDDPQPWFDLGRLRLVAGDVDGAEIALARARELDPERPEIASAHGESLARIADGLVTPAARQAFETALTGDASDPRARYFLALANYQAGYEQDALEAWASLAGDAAADAPWLPTVLARVTDTARELGHDPADWLPQSTASTPTPETRGPTGDDIAAAQSLSEDERQEMIRGMVDNLAARLEGEPDDLAGWRMLARSWEMLGNPGAAAQAYARAVALEPDHAETLLRAAITSAESGDIEAARANFVRLRDLIPPETDAHRMVIEAITRLDSAGR